MNLREIFQLAIVSSFLCVKIIWVQSFKQAWCMHNYTSGISTAYCDIDWRSNDPNWGHEYPLIPDNIPVTLQVIHIRPRDRWRFNAVFLWPNTFKRYPQLQRIINQENQQIRLTNVAAKKSEMQENFTKIFSSLNSLEYLEISSSYYEDWLVVHLPKQLKSLNFDDNGYRKLDVHWAQDLEEISVKRNILENIPKLATLPSPPVLKILRLSGNPLNNMTIVDIAPLCNLGLLELNFSTNSIYVKESGYCMCTLLKKWVNETKLRGLENVKCFDAGNRYFLLIINRSRDIIEDQKFLQANKPNCPEQILEEARRIRKQCPLLEKGETSDSIIKAMKYAVMFIILALLLAGIMLYVIRHFYLREHWAGLNQPTSIRMEEEEEEEEEEEMDS